jgi:carboxyl-terminal processing protease
MAIFGVIALMFLQLPPMVAKQDSVVNTYRALVEVDALAKQQFVEPIRDDRLVDGAIRGMMLQLDPYSGYIAPDELSAFQRRNRGEYIGIGIEVGVRDGRLIVIAPIENSPAAKAGILAGDAILAIDGEDIEGLSVFDVDERLAGRPGTSVTLRTQHVGRDEPEDITIFRGPVSIQTVRGFRRGPDGRWDYMIDPERHIGYVRVSSFHRNTMRDFEAVLTEILHRGARGLVLDLRFNPGGLMDQAVAMVDWFVNHGMIVSTVTRRKAVHEYPATRRSISPEVRLAVLINDGSASASEIVAGALQAYERAVIVGSRSFGKGSVQHLIHLESNDAAIKLTAAYYRLPNGRIIHRTHDNEHTDSWGVQPDVQVLLDDKEVTAIQHSRRALDTAFAESSVPLPGEESGDAGDARPRPRTPQIIRDRQLTAALSVLNQKIANAQIPSR